MGSKEVVARRGLLPGDDIAYGLPHIDKSLTPGAITHGRESLKDIVFRGLEISRAKDGAFSQVNAQEA